MTLYGEKPDEEEVLAAVLYEELEHCDPSIEFVPYSELPDFDRTMYRSCVSRIVSKIKAEAKR